MPSRRAPELAGCRRDHSDRCDRCACSSWLHVARATCAPGQAAGRLPRGSRTGEAQRLPPPAVTVIREPDGDARFLGGAEGTIGRQRHGGCDWTIRSRCRPSGTGGRFDAAANRQSMSLARWWPLMRLSQESSLRRTGRGRLEERSCPPRLDDLRRCKRHGVGHTDCERAEVVERGDACNPYFARARRMMAWSKRAGVGR